MTTKDQSRYATLPAPESASEPNYTGANRAQLEAWGRALRHDECAYDEPVAVFVQWNDGTGRISPMTILIAVWEAEVEITREGLPLLKRPYTWAMDGLSPAASAGQFTPMDTDCWHHDPKIARFTKKKPAIDFTHHMYQSDKCDDPQLVWCSDLWRKEAQLIVDHQRALHAAAGFLRQAKIASNEALRAADRRFA